MVDAGAVVDAGADDVGGLEVAGADVDAGAEVVGWVEVQLVNISPIASTMMIANNSTFFK